LILLLDIIFKFNKAIISYLHENIKDSAMKIHIQLNLKIDTYLKKL